ncbi:MAG: YqjK family protein [Betaproteobacteria bacterium]
MRERLLTLAGDRSRLSARAQAEREHLSTLLAPADAAASLATSLFQAGRRAADQARRRPLLVAAGVVLLVVLRPRRAVSWLARGWSLWRLYRGANGWWLRFAASTGSSSRPAR